MYIHTYDGCIYIEPREKQQQQSEGGGNVCVFWGISWPFLHLCPLWLRQSQIIPYIRKKKKKNLLGEVDENGNLHPFWLKKKTS
jgi:hypothetical protein